MLSLITMKLQTFGTHLSAVKWADIQFNKLVACHFPGSRSCLHGFTLGNVASPESDIKIYILYSDTELVYLIQRF